MTRTRGGRTDEYGAVARRKARSTGTTVSLFVPGAQSSDEGWMTLCEDHGGCIMHVTRRDAEGWLSHPEEWCPYCMGDEVAWSTVATPTGSLTK